MLSYKTRNCVLINIKRNENRFPNVLKSTKLRSWQYFSNDLTASVSDVEHFQQICGWQKALDIVLRDGDLWRVGEVDQLFGDRRFHSDQRNAGLMWFGHITSEHRLEFKKKFKFHELKKSMEANLIIFDIAIVTTVGARMNVMTISKWWH